MHRSKQAATLDVEEQVRCGSLQSVGVTADLRYTLGLQATGALAHLASQPGGCTALLSIPGALESAVRLLGSKIPDAEAMATMLLGVVTGGCANVGVVGEPGRAGRAPMVTFAGLGAAGGKAPPPGCPQMSRCAGLLEALAGACGEGGNHNKQVG